MKIGITTLYNYNYGSALQCYATQRYIEENYCDCVLVDKKKDNNRLIFYFKTLTDLFLKCFAHPRSIKAIYSQLKSQRAGSLRLSKESLREIERFVFCNINKIEYKYKDLKKIAKTKEYSYFLSGSDQVWNGARINKYDMFFLRFAPKEKRIAWSPSFGADKVSKYNHRIYSKYISQYHKLSTREKSGEEIIRQMTGKNAEVLCDPVVLYSGEKWREKYKNNTSIKIQERYICLFFIDEISETAFNFVNNLLNELNCKCISFGYNSPRYNNIKNHSHYDGSPYDFLYCLDKAETVLTDSFHAAVFSALFHTEFYVFTRNYTNDQNQSTRLTHLLDRIGEKERFDTSVKLPQIDFSKADNYFNAERNKSREFLRHCLGSEKKEKVSDILVLFEDSSKCCGCGACVDICPQNAISICSDSGEMLPAVNHSLCIKCNKCSSVCGLKKTHLISKFVKNAYLGKGKDSNLIQNSASGGIFSSLAEQFLSEGGIVYGASLVIEQNTVTCHHVRVDNNEKLDQIKNSKYVQSSTVGIFGKVKMDLDLGLNVLFSGTSCQVASLLSYLGNKNINNLFTVDLVCHGVPSVHLLQSYIDYIHRTKKANVIGLSFRTKDRSVSKFTPYVLKIELRYDDGAREIQHISLRDSAYYRLFMSMAGYRKSCYNCKFASINKPADLTLGDYYVCDSKSAFVSSLQLDSDQFYSCIIVHSDKGKRLLCSTELELNEIPVEDVVFDHEHLQYASMPTLAGNALLSIYKEKGFDGLQRYIDKKNRIIDIGRKVKISKIFTRKTI